MKILVVDDDEKISKILTAYLVRDGYTVKTAPDGLAALDLVKSYQPDLVLLDLMLPGLDGKTVCREIRRTSNIPIIMLTAMTGDDDRIGGLDIGADDYVTKPFNPREVLARIRAIMRRSAPASPQDDAAVLRIGCMSLNTSSRVLEVDGASLELTPTEYKLLELFMSHPNQVFSRLQLVEYVQGYSYEGYERTIDSHIKNLRKKLGDTAGGYIKTVYGMGYKMTGDAHA
jgi:DNA-binding response OmpR family regulator